VRNGRPFEPIPPYRLAALDRVGEALAAWDESPQSPEDKAELMAALEEYDAVDIHRGRRLR
jgi:hypothetical protein